MLEHTNGTQKTLKLSYLLILLLLKAMAGRAVGPPRKTSPLPFCIHVLVAAVRLFPMDQKLRSLGTVPVAT